MFNMVKIMTESIDNLKARWLSEKGMRFMAAVLNPLITPEIYQQACIEFFGKKDSYVKSETHRGVGDFEDLRGMDFSGRNLNDMLFGGSELSFANFENCVLEGTSFGSAKLYSTSFKSVEVHTNVNFFECYARGANFHSANLTAGNFYHADLTDADFTNAVFIRCDFGSVFLQNALFDGVQMIECDVRGMHLSESQRNAEWLKTSTLINKEHIIWHE